MGAVAESHRAQAHRGLLPRRASRSTTTPRATPAMPARGTGGESHFNVVIEAAAFEGLAACSASALVYAALAEELAGPVHALSVKALAPGEAA